MTCYRCNSTVNAKCIDLGDTSIQPKPCPPDDNFYKGFISVCTKIVSEQGKNLKLFSIFHNLSIVLWIYVGELTRDCLPIQSRDSDPCSLARQTNLNKIKFCGMCSNDGCNSGNSLKFFFELSVFGILLCTARLFAYLWNIC